MWGACPTRSSHVWVAGVFDGIKPAVTAIVVQATVRIGQRALKNGAMWAVAAAAFVAIFALKVPFPLIIVGAALVGWLGARWAPQWFGAAAPAAAPNPHAGHGKH